MGTYGTTATVRARATISNSSTSSQTLKLSDAWKGYSIYAPIKDGVVDCCSYVGGFGYDEPFPWSGLTQQLRGIVLAPGQSQTLDFIRLAPQYSTGVAPGNYSVDASFTICPNGACQVTDSRIATVSWTVSAVPEPTAGLLLAAGLGVVGWSARASRLRP